MFLFIYYLYIYIYIYLKTQVRENEILIQKHTINSMITF